MKQLKTLLLASIVTLFTTFANAVPVNLAPIISYLLSDSETSALNTLAGKTLYTTIYDIPNTLESWTYNADMTSATWVEIVGGSDSGTGTLSVDGMTMIYTEGVETNTIVVTEILEDYLLISVNGGAAQRLYFDENKARAYFLGLEGLLAGKTLYTTIYELPNTLESWTYNADMTSATWVEIVGGTDSGTGTLSVDGMTMIYTEGVETNTIVVTEILEDYLLMSVEGGAAQRLYFDEAEARAYFLGNDIIGTWYLGDASQENNIVTMTFFSNGSYVMLQDGDSNPVTGDDSGQDGMERGTYSWNAITGAFQSVTITDTNGEWGLSHPLPNVTFMVENNVLTITEGADSFTLNRVEDTFNDIIGTWYFGDASQSNNIVTMTFFSNGSYVMLQDGDSNPVSGDDSGQDGMERGTYSWNAITGAFQSVTITDTNGEWGLSHPLPNFTFMVENNVLTITEGADSFTLNRYPLQ